MKKSLLLTILIIILAIIGSMMLFACTDASDDNVGDITIDINDESDFLNIKNMLGENYKNATFKLTNDIYLDSENWQPIGDSIENSFRGTLCGNGKSIYLSISDHALENAIFGIFGYSFDAKFDNLKIETSYSLSTNVTTTYIGGLTGIAYGDCQFTNINIYSDIYIEPLAASKYSHQNDVMEFLIDKVTYTGGLFGYAVGQVDIDGINAAFSLNMPMAYGEHEGYSNENRFYSVYTGGLGGMIRTNDISESNTIRNTIKNVNITPFVTIDAFNIYAGSAVGMLYNADVTDVNVKMGQSLGIHGLKHSLVGGAFGLCDNTVLSNVTVNLDLKSLPSKLPGRDSSLCIGGIVGYVNNNSKISDVSYKGSIEAKVSDNTESFGGGLAGVISNSEVSNIVVEGGFIIGGKDTAQEIMDNLQNLIYSLTMLRHYAGVVGRIHGYAVLDDIDCNFVAYQGIVSIITPIIVPIKEDVNGKEKVVDIKIDKIPTINDSVTFYAENSIAHFYDLIDSDDEKYKSNGYGTVKDIINEEINGEE